MSEPLVEIVTTVSSEHDGARIARELIAERIAACVSMRHIRSMYRWAGELCDEKEVELVIKTLASCADRAEEKLRELHSYEVPAILRIPVFRVNDEYSSWVERSVQVPPGTEP